jgi:hypothetical protein
MKQGWGPHSWIRLTLFESSEEAAELFERACQRDPAAVARVDFLFPEERQKQDAARFLGLETPVAIPSVGELAAELAETVRDAPDSAAAEKAKRDLGILLSSSALKGAPPRGGRPAIQWPDESVLHVYKMSYSLTRQMREVDRLLDKHEQSANKRQAIVRNLYPRPCKDLTDVLSFLQLQPSHAAYELAGCFLELSESTVKKVTDRNRLLL